MSRFIRTAKEKLRQINDVKLTRREKNLVALVGTGVILCALSPVLSALISTPGLALGMMQFAGSTFVMGAACIAATGVVSTLAIMIGVKLTDRSLRNIENKLARPIAIETHEAAPAQSQVFKPQVPSKKPDQTTQAIAKTKADILHPSVILRRKKTMDTVRDVKKQLGIKKKGSQRRLAEWMVK